MTHTQTIDLTTEWTQDTIERALSALPHTGILRVRAILRYAEFVVIDTVDPTQGVLCGTGDYICGTTAQAARHILFQLG